MLGRQTQSREPMEQSEQCYVVVGGVLQNNQNKQKYLLKFKLLSQVKHQKHLYVTFVCKNL